MCVRFGTNRPRLVSRGSGTGVSPVRFESHGRDARATTAAQGQFVSG